MGVQIGQTSAAALRLDSIAVRRRARTGNDQLSEQARPREEQDDIRAGFGRDTLSPQGAALETVSKNLARARELVPSVEELSARAREAAAREAAETAARQQRAREAEAVAKNGGDTAATEQPVTAVPKAEPFARFFEAQEKKAAASEQSAPAQEAREAQAAAEENEAPAPTPEPAQRDGAAALLDLLA